MVTINTYREPGMERYWIPSIPESALFGTKLADETFLVNTGGDVAFLNGALKHMHRARSASTTTSSTSTRPGLTKSGRSRWRKVWAELERASGCAASRDARTSASCSASAKTAVLVWSMGVTQHAFGEDDVRAIVNLGPDPGFVGRDRCGLMPIRGHSGVQGGAEMGAYATAFPGGRRSTTENAAQLPQAMGIRGPVDARADRAGNDRRGRTRAISTCSSRSGGNFLRGDARSEVR